MEPTDRVLIVGAGIAGLALACRLRSVGIAHDIIERKAHPDSHGAGILLTGNAIRALDSIGLGSVVASHGRRVDRVRFTDQDERELFGVDLQAQTRWPPFVSIQRAALQRLLLHAARPCEPRWNTRLHSIQLRDHEVDVEFTDGTTARYALVVGADGVHSDLRTRVFGLEAARPIPGYLGWRFLAPCPVGLSCPQYMLGNGRTLLLHPLPNGEVYCGAGPIAVDAPTGPGTDLDRMRTAFADFGGHAVETLSHASEDTLIPSWYFHLELPNWYAQRCVLIGDAAHAAAPTLAQGAALAIEDSIVLAELLAASTNATDALVSYEQRRRPRVSAVQSASLERMHANRPVSTRALSIRHALLQRIGAAQLLGAWARLMETSP